MSNASFKYTPSPEGPPVPKKPPFLGRRKRGTHDMHEAVAEITRSGNGESASMADARDGGEKAEKGVFSRGRKPAPWGPFAAISYTIATYLAAQLIGSVLVILYPHLRGWSKSASERWLNQAITAQFWFVLATEALMFGAVWWFVRLRGAGLRRIGWRWPRLKDLLYALIGFGVYVLGYLVLLGIATRVFSGINVDQRQQLGFTNPAGSFNLTLTFISLVVLPPLVEETLFRGFVFTGLRNKLNFVWAALVTSAIFASLHLEFGSGKPLLWVAAIDTFTLSMVACYLREKTDSLWPGIVLHALKNLVAFMALFLAAHF